MLVICTKMKVIYCLRCPISFQNTGAIELVNEQRKISIFDLNLDIVLLILICVNAIKRQESNKRQCC